MTVDRIVEQDKTLEKLRAWEDINEIGLFLGRNLKMTALIAFKNKVTLQNKTQDGCSTESCISQSTLQSAYRHFRSTNE